MKQMLILIGPQGSGNHMWSKIFSSHDEVYGWKSLLENYWEAHRFSEPFCKEWREHSLLKHFDWSTHNYFFTSISCPLGIPNSTENPLWVPDVVGFRKTVEELGINTKVAVIGRDQNILKYQQDRVRTESTLPIFMEALQQIEDPIFLSYELLYLYKDTYLKSINVNIPVDINISQIDVILQNDANSRYVVPAGPSLDDCNRTGATVKNINHINKKGN